MLSLCHLGYILILYVCIIFFEMVSKISVICVMQHIDGFLCILGLIFLTEQRDSMETFGCLFLSFLSNWLII